MDRHTRFPTLKTTFFAIIILNNFVGDIVLAFSFLIRFNFQIVFPTSVTVIATIGDWVVLMY